MPSMTLTCYVCNLPMQRRKYSKSQGEAAHNACRVTHGASRYRRGCRCDACRAGHNATHAAYVRRRKDRDGVELSAQYRRRQRGVDPLAVVHCFICSEPLRNVRSGQVRYPLHKVCRQTAPEWIRRGWDNPRRASFQSKIDKAAQGTSGGGRVFVNGSCAWCSEVFTSVAGVYCSDRCKTASKFKRRSSGKTFSISPKVRLEIYERDSWTCKLCMRQVDGSLHHRDNWAASLDHIIPQSQMLIPDHSPSNLRLVHRMCNSMRGDGLNMTEAEFQKRITRHFEGVAA